MKNIIRYIDLKNVSPEVFSTMWEVDFIIDIQVPTIFQYTSDRVLCHLWEPPRVYTNISSLLLSKELLDVYMMRCYAPVDIFLRDPNDNTAYELVQAISLGSKFQARREEQIKSSHYFCRVKSDQYNYSQNPTYYTGSNAELKNSTFVQDPKSYITTVGLYNNKNELLAVAKLSQPLLKSKDREAVIKVRLDF